MIIDASVALKWIVREDDSDVALTLLSRVDLMAPSLVHIEVANALWKKHRRGELAGLSNLSHVTEPLWQLLQTVDEQSVLARALEIAILLDHAVDDCVYLALAEQLSVPLLTADLKFARKCEGHGFVDQVHIL